MCIRDRPLSNQEVSRKSNNSSLKDASTSSNKPTRSSIRSQTSTEKVEDASFSTNINEVNLKSLVERYPNLDIKQDWPRILSLGEQQRLAFARLLLNSPRFAVLDEATSALDIKTEKRLYNLLRDRELSLISVGHRPSLKEFHENILELSGEGDLKLFTTDKYNFKN